MALAERKNAKDCISIYYTNFEWKLVNHLEVETFDLADIQWAREDTTILVLDTPLESKVLLYSAMTGDLLSRFALQGPGLGVK